MYSKVSQLDNNHLPTNLQSENHSHTQKILQHLTNPPFGLLIREV